MRSSSTPPTVYVTVKAVEDPNGSGGGGEGGNLSAGDVITFANPLANVQRAAAVTAQTVTGADAETTDEYRQRVVDRFQRRPQGGAPADYDEWGNTVAGIANIYPYTGAPGQVDVYVESSTETDGIPTTAQMEAVYSAIQYDNNGLASRRPLSGWVNVLPIKRTAFSVVVSNVTADDLAAVQGRHNRGSRAVLCPGGPVHRRAGHTAALRHSLANGDRRDSKRHYSRSGGQLYVCEFPT